VSGKKLVNGTGATLQIRGADASTLEFYPIEIASTTLGSSPVDYWAANYPNFPAMEAWRLNGIRVPLNEQCYLNQTCYQAITNGAPPTAYLADTINGYRQCVKYIVDACAAAGFYVILDLHKNTGSAILSNSSDPNPVQLLSNTTGQSEFSDPNSINFWTTVATDYLNYTNVIFDLFNEPHIDHFVDPGSYPPNPGTTIPGGTSTAELIEWTVLRDGGTGQLIYGNNNVFTQNYTAPGMQAMLNAIRGTGSTAVCMIGGVSYAQDQSLWTQFCPIDTIGQIACSWHAYPSAGAPTQPGYPNNFIWAATILAANYPIIIGETGDNTGSSASAQWMETLMPWCDAHNVSVFAWAFDGASVASPFLLNSQATGAPGTGYGVAYQTWTYNHP
jgi:hypothetical protein